MKTLFTYLLLSTLLISGTLLLNSCSDQTESESSVYLCPMDCENGKTYTEDSGCPVCGMHLKVEEETSKVLEDDSTFQALQFSI